VFAPLNLRSLSHHPWLIQAVILLAPALMILLRPYYGRRNRKSSLVQTRVI
jgi:hypothetical protein